MLKILIFPEVMPKTFPSYMSRPALCFSLKKTALFPQLLAAFRDCRGQKKNAPQRERFSQTAELLFLKKRVFVTAAFLGRVKGAVSMIIERRIAATVTRIDGDADTGCNRQLPAIF